MPPVPFKVPAWADPNNASVLDSPLQKAARTLGGMFGAADPQAQVMGIAAPLEVPGGKTIPAFHGTVSQFDQFADPPTGKVLWFTKDPEDAARYSQIAARAGGEPRVLAADVTLKRDGAQRLKELGHMMPSQAFEQLKREGYDGFTDGPVVAVFRGGQAKIKPPSK
jgi:hypothetical protein